VVAACISWSVVSAQATTRQQRLELDALTGQSRLPQPADTAAVVLQNRTIFVFRASFGARAPQERAADATRRIRALAETGSAGPADTVRVARIPEGILIAVGQSGIFTVTAADVDSVAGESLGTVSAEAARRLADALVAERDQRSLAYVLTAAGLALAATLASLMTLRLLRRVQRAALRKIRRVLVAGPRLSAASVGGFTLLRPEQVLGFLRRAVDLGAWGAGLLLAYVWLTFVLTRFPYSRPWGEALGVYLVTTVKELSLGALVAIPGLFTVVVIFFATRFLSRLVTTFFTAVESGEVPLPWVHADTAQPTRRIINALLWLFAVVVAYPYLPGSGSDVFKGVTVFVGLMLSLGSSGLVNQAMSGLVLMYSRALKPGDYVRIDDIEGTVTELGLLSTKIRTNKREEMTLPNAFLVGTATKNYSRLAADGGGVILYTSVTIGYDTPWRQVHALLIAAAARTEGLRHEPPPFIRQTGLSDFYAEYQLNAYLDQPDQRVAVLSDLHGHIQDCFNEHGVQIMSPHYENDPAVPKVVPPERWYAAPGGTPGGSVVAPARTPASVSGHESEARV
jgi:small-conductance mechanosensitive channel